jgi:hypothetical protein
MIKKALSLFFLYALAVFSFSCASPPPQKGGTTSSSPVTEPSGFFLQTEYAEYDAGTEQIKLIFGREDGKSFQYNLQYVLYADRNGTWEQLAFDADHFFTLALFEARKTDPNAFGTLSASHPIRLTDLSTELTPGRYRVQKDFEGVSVFTEFVIKESSLKTRYTKGGA